MGKKEDAQQATQQVTIDDDTKRALQKLANDNTGEVQDSTKFTLLENFHNDQASPYYTEYLKQEEVFQMNEIEDYAELIPVVFGNDPMVLAIANLFKRHANHHRVNMASMKRKRELALVHAVRNDSSVVSTDSAIKKFTGAGK